MHVAVLKHNKPSIIIIYYEALCLCINSVLQAYYWRMCSYRVRAEGTSKCTTLHSTNVVRLISDLVRMGFVVDKVALRLVFLRALRFSPVLIYYHRRFNTLSVHSVFR